MRRLYILFLALTYVLLGRADGLSDYLYATELRVDDYDGSTYFNVSLQGSKCYSGFGVDVQLPNGLEVAVDNGAPYVVMIDFSYQIDEEVIYPYTKDRRGNYSYTHTIMSSFPDEKDNKHVRVACFSSMNEKFTEESGALFRVYVKKTCSSTQWPIGEIKIHDVELNVDTDTRFYPCTSSKIVAMYEGTSTLPFNVSAANRWSTCILPFTATVPEGVKAYTVSSYDEENLNLKEEKTMEAYTPYILYSEDGYQGTLSGTVDASGYPEKGYTDGSVLKGAIVAQTVKNGYVMQKQDGEVMFYKIKEGDSFSVPAGKCWLELPTGSSAKSLSFTFEDETGIDTVRPAVKTSDIYLIDGRRVSEPQPGKLYIKGGAKYVKQ